MSPAEQELAHRLAAVLGIWRAGMLDTLGRTVLAVRDGMCLCAWWTGPTGAEQPNAGWVQPSGMGSPDLDDAATRGALLDVARNKHHTFASPEYLGADGWRFGPFRAESDGAAIALAILEAPASA